MGIELNEPERTVLADSSQDRERDRVVPTDGERYRVVEDTLIVNKPGYIINARFGISGDQLIVSAEDFRAVLKRMR